MQLFRSDLHHQRFSIQYIKRAEDAERELHDLKRDNDQLRDDIRDYQRQLDAQRETMVTRRDDNDAVRETIAKKNRMLSDALEENRVSPVFVQWQFLYQR